MNKFTIVAIIFAISSVNSQSSSRPDYCTKEEQGTLEWRVNHAEVVITATINRIDSERHYVGGKDALDVLDNGTEHVNTHKPSDRHAVGIVKLWRVVKGSIEHVTNYSLEQQDVLDGDSPKIMDIQNPIIKLYGLRNDHVCGSYLGAGDTRIFFLRKFQDFRPDLFQFVNATIDKSVGLLAAPPGQIISKSTVESSTTITAQGENGKSSKPPKKGKHRRGKKKRRKGKKGERSRKSKKGGKRKSRRKRRKTSESTFQKFRKLRRLRRDTMSPVMLPQIRHLPLDRVRRHANDEPRQVLVLVSAPARITLQNLNYIESMMDLE